MATYDWGTKTISIRDIIKAMRKNGYPKSIGNYFLREGSGVVEEGTQVIVFGEACAMGQAAINLHVTAHSIAQLLHGAHTGNEWADEFVIHMNDQRNATVAEIADKLDALLSEEAKDKTVDAVPQRYRFRRKSEIILGS